MIEILIKEFPARLGVEWRVKCGPLLHSFRHVLTDRLLLDVGYQISPAPVARPLYEAKDKPFLSATFLVSDGDFPIVNHDLATELLADDTPGSMTGNAFSAHGVDAIDLGF